MAHTLCWEIFKMNHDPTEKYEVSVIEAQARADLDIQISTAKHYPRNIQKGFQNALAMAQTSREIAESCFYTLPRGGKRITGPSIRLAEIIQHCWGNIRVKSGCIDETPEYVVCQASAIDLEANVGVSVEVRRRITDKDGNRYNTDVIEKTVNAARAIAERNAIFKVVPMVYVLPIYEAARQLAVGKESDLDERRTRCIKYFESLGVPSTVLLKHLGKMKATDIKLDDIEYLLGIQSALKEGDADQDEIFALTRDGRPMDGTQAEKKPDLNDVADAATTRRTRKTKEDPKPEPAVEVSSEVTTEEAPII